MAEFTIHPKYMRKVTLKSLHQIENMSKTHTLQEAPFIDASLETQVTTRWQQVSLISPSHNSYTRGTTTWYDSANHSSYALKVPKFE